jgi:oxygen-dependent protoporphyrinogen oxidase
MSVNTSVELGKKKVTIVGGGFSGLTLAFELQQKGFQVEVLEKKSWGGLIQTQFLPEMQVETAANAFLMSERLGDLAQAIGCELIATQTIAKRRFIFRGMPRRWPLSLSSTFRILFRILPVLILDRGRFAPKPMETVQAWALRVLNQEMYDYLISPALQGIYAGDVRELSASLLFGYLFEKKKKRCRQSASAQKTKSLKGSVAPRNGMGEFIQKLRRTLEGRGVLLKVQEVHDLKELDGPKVLAVPPPELGSLLAASYGDDLGWSRVPMLNLVRLTVGFRSPQKKVDGFGILFPESEKFNSLGVLANSQIFENRGDLYNESWILGGARSPEMSDLTDSRILELILEDRARALGVRDEVSSFKVIRWPQGLTHYTVAHEKFLQDQKPLPKDVFLTGNFLGRLGLSKILEQNAELAEKLLVEYGTLTRGIDK